MSAETDQLQVVEPVSESLKRFIWDIQSMVELDEGEREILFIGRDLMQRLVASDGWLPAAFTKADPSACQHFQLYRDDLARFTVVSTVLAPGQSTPIAQAGVWEIAGILRGPIERASFTVTSDSKLEPKGAPALLSPGTVETRGAKVADAIQLSNALPGEVAISIHVYGGAIEDLARRTFTLDGEVSEAPVVYANTDATPAYDILTIQTRIVD